MTQRIKNVFLNFISELGSMTLFLRQVLKSTSSLKHYKSELLFQMYKVGTSAMAVTIISGLFVGAIFATQFYIQLTGFGANSFIGGLNTSGTIRDLGPLLVAFMLAGKIGAFMSAELGTMRVTNQIDAIRCLGTDPFEYLLAPRFIAIVVMTLVLLFFALVISVAGGILALIVTANINPIEYVSKIPELVNSISILTGLAKSFVFGFLIAWICCYLGYTTTGGAKGVGITVNQTAVTTVVAIVLADFSVAAIIDWAYSIFGGIG